QGQINRRFVASRRHLAERCGAVETFARRALQHGGEGHASQRLTLGIGELHGDAAPVIGDGRLPTQGSLRPTLGENVVKTQALLIGAVADQAGPARERRPDHQAVRRRYHEEGTDKDGEELAPAERAWRGDAHSGPRNTVSYCADERPTASVRTNLKSVDGGRTAPVGNRTEA